MPRNVNVEEMRKSKMKLNWVYALIAGEDLNLTICC